VVRLEASVVPDADGVLPDELDCELVQPARATAQQTRTISTRIVLAFIPDDDGLVYLTVAIVGSAEGS
jgi:hypothetical protein